VFAIAGLIIAGRVYQDAPALRSGQYKIAVAGLLYLILFVILRAISLHQFATVLNYEICGEKINRIAEWMGIFWVGLAAFWPCRSQTSNEKKK